LKGTTERRKFKLVPGRKGIVQVRDWGATEVTLFPELLNELPEKPINK